MITDILVSLYAFLFLLLINSVSTKIVFYFLNPNTLFTAESSQTGVTVFTVLAHEHYDHRTSVTGFEDICYLFGIIIKTKIIMQIVTLRYNFEKKLIKL